jgi:fatty-acyl-CoA synthase
MSPARPTPPTADRPRSPAATWARALAATQAIVGQPDRTLPAIVDELAEQWEDAPALLSDGETLSYRALSERCNRYARWALAAGVRKGDTVCLLMDGRPDYVATWLGITRVGGVVALLNTQLVGGSLAHCIDVARPRHIIVSAGRVADLLAAWPHVAARPERWVVGGCHAGFQALDEIVAQNSGEALHDDERRAVTIEDRALAIYTSGTTGLPKAA